MQNATLMLMSDCSAFVLWKYGKQLRARSPAAIQLAKQLEDAEQARVERAAAKERSGLQPA